MSKINILGTKVDMVDMKGAMEAVKEFLKSDEPSCVFTPNSEIIMAAYRDGEFLKILNSADLIIPDGIGVVYASKILKKPLLSALQAMTLRAIFWNM